MPGQIKIEKQVNGSVLLTVRNNAELNKYKTHENIHKILNKK